MSNTLLQVSHLVAGGVRNLNAVLDVVVGLQDGGADALHEGVHGLLHVAEAGELVEDVLQESSGSRVGVGSRNGKVVITVNGVVSEGF